LITIDTLRADRLGAYRYERATSPAIDAIAAEGVVFERAFAPRAMTWPSLATLLTAQRPTETNVRMNGQLMPGGLETVAAALRRAGYRTAALIGGSTCHMVRAKGDFDELRCGEDAALTQFAADYFVTKDERPFFLWIHYMAPHAPYAPSYEHDGFRASGYAGPVRGDRPTLDRLILEQVALGSDDIAELGALYDGEVRTADEEVAFVDAALAAAGLVEDTIVALTADHGEDLYDHNRYLFHACSVYDSSLRVPLVLRLPDRSAAGSRYEEVVGLIDLAPTLLDLAGIAAPRSFRGESLLPRLAAAQAGKREGDWDRIAVSEYYNHKDGVAFLSLRSRRWRYVHNPTGYLPTCIPRGDYYEVQPQELYDHGADSQEAVNVAAAHPDVVARFREALGSLALGDLERRGLPIEKSLEGELRALGYLE
jgi:arylsulfatase A-like enzyme